MVHLIDIGMSGDLKSSMPQQPQRNTSRSMAECATSYDEPASRPPSESFKAWGLSHTLTSVCNKMDTIITGQVALEQRCIDNEARIYFNASDIKKVAKSLEFKSAFTKDNSSDIKAMKKIKIKIKHYN